MIGRLSPAASGHTSARQLGTSAPQPVATIRPAPGGAWFDPKRLAKPQNAPSAVPTPGGWATPAAPPPAAPPIDPGLVVPQTVGTPSWPQQWQSQQAYQQQTVSVPVTVVTQPQMSNYFNPPQASGDLGPMGTVSEALGIQGANSQKCLTWGLVGLGLAWFLSKRHG